MEKLSIAATMFCALVLAALAAAAGGEAAVVEHTFVVHEMNQTHLCNTTKIYVVNGQLPGPTIDITDGDTVVVHVINRLPHGLTIHWHGVRQMRSCWSDGAGFVTECPIPPDGDHVYRFNVTGQLDLVELDRRMHDGNFDDNPLSATINGKLGDLSNCSGKPEESFVLDVVRGKTYLLRIVNTALFSEYYFKVAGHTFTVVGADGYYLTPYKTDMVTVAPGEAIDVLMAADALPAHYHMVALANQPPEPDPQIPGFVSRGLIRYAGSSHNNNGLQVPTPLMPSQHNTMPSYYFHSNLTGLAHPDRHRVPMHVDKRLFFTLGLGSICRGTNKTCQRRRSPETIVVATMNNVSFRHPTNTSLLERYYDKRTSGVYTEDLPDHPPHPYNYTDRSLIPPGPLEEALEPTSKATKLRRFRYNTSVEIIFQSTALLQSDSNPMHLHGYDFFVLATGLGNYNPKTDPKKFNYHNPQLRNTVHVPRTGWAVVRFVTDNPGMWYLHCHFEFHIIMGMATAFIVENGPTPETSLPPPPPEFKSTVASPNRRSFLNTSTGECVQVDLPELHDHCVLALTSEGLLVLVHHKPQRNTVRLLNPFTGHLTELPPLTTLLSPHDQHMRMDLIGRFKRVLAAWGSGVANDDSTVVLCFNTLDVLGMAKPGDDHWTLLKCQFGSMLSPLMLAGRFYCVNWHNGVMSIIRRDASFHRAHLRLQKPCLLVSPHTVGDDPLRTDKVGLYMWEANQQGTAVPFVYATDFSSGKLHVSAQSVANSTGTYMGQVDGAAAGDGGD
ncbi:Laccase-19 [Triticum urartu]|uniref:laccase n=1 Tax=Triticum urartu TaxID=4572 RepID=M8A4C9_TRIUA|nr:Laccase-19 [Triticum urartu]